MECEEIQRQLSLFIDGALEPAQQPPVLTHIAGCAECRGFFQGALRIRQAGQTEQIRLPDEADQEVLDAISYVRMHARRPVIERLFVSSFMHRRWAVPAPVFAMILLAMLTAGFALSRFIFPSPSTATNPASVLQSVEALKRPGSVIVVYMLPEEQIPVPMPKQAIQRKAM